MLGVLTVRAAADGTPAWVATLLRAPLTWWLARVVLTLPYWWSGLSKLLHPHAALAEITAMGLGAPIVVYLATLLVQLGGSLLVIFNRWTWLGAGALAVFTALATVLAHAFWTLEGAARQAALNTFLEHLALIAAFVMAAMLAEAVRRRPQDSSSVTS